MTKLQKRIIMFVISLPFALFGILFFFFQGSYTIIQCDKDYHQAVIYIELGASERTWAYEEECDDYILFDRATSCFRLTCK